MFKKRIFIVLVFLGFLLSFGCLQVIEALFKADTKSKQELVFTPKTNHPTYLLIHELKSTSPLVRRTAITELSRRKDPLSLTPLFELLMNSNDNDSELRMVAKAIFNVTDGKILPLAILYLQNYEKNLNPQDDKKSDKKDTNIDKISVTTTQAERLLFLCENATPKLIKNYSYNLDFLNELLQDDSAKIKEAVLRVIRATGYENSFTTLKKLYGHNSNSLDEAILMNLTSIALSFPKHKFDVNQFILNLLKKKQTNLLLSQKTHQLYYSLFLNRPLNMLEAKLSSLLAGLSLEDVDRSMKSEKIFLSLKGHLKDEGSLINFFAFYQGSFLLRERLLALLLSMNETEILSYSHLLENIKNRYNNSDSLDHTVNLVNLSIRALGENLKSEDDLKLLLSVLGDKKFNETVLDVVLKLLKKDEFKDFLEQPQQVEKIRALFYNRSGSLGKVIYILYKLKNFEYLQEALNSQGESVRSLILDEFLNYPLSDDEKTEIYEAFKDSFTNDRYQKIINQFKVS